LKIAQQEGHWFAQKDLPGASKFCSWAGKNGSLVVRWANETTLSSFVKDDFQNNFKTKGAFL